ncbi:MAG: hypothetical protein HY226_06530 [Candidatus Vogelbacteria bacterium]|nr:hypothetical protein [Candidatus Vogelbacteria bacterium]
MVQGKDFVKKLSETVTETYTPTLHGFVVNFEIEGISATIKARCVRNDNNPVVTICIVHVETKISEFPLQDLDVIYARIKELSK